jgi:hypothetical protein
MDILTAELDRVDKDISRIANEKNLMQTGLTQTTTKTSEKITALANQIAALQTTKNRLLDLQGFDQRLAELESLRAASANYNANLAARTAERDAAVAERDAAIAAAAAKDTTIATLNTQITVLNGTIEARDIQIIDLNARIVNLEAQIAALLAQLPGDAFVSFDEMRIGDVSMHGFQDLLVVYENSMVRPGDANTAPPNAAFLNTYFGNLKAANPTVNRIVLDYETWALTTGSNSTLAANMTVVGYYVTLVNAAKAHFSDVGLYGEIPTRQFAYLNYPVGHATYVSRKNAVDAVNAAMQPIWDAVDTIYPSLYLLSPVHNNESKLDLWLTDNATACATHAAGKKVYPFVQPANHPSLGLPEHWMPGDYWYGLLNKVYDRFDGYALWLDGGETHPENDVPVPDWWPYTLQFQGERGLLP